MPKAERQNSIIEGEPAIAALSRLHSESAAALSVDPVYTAIEAHRSAAARVMEVSVEIDRLLALADEKVGPCKISVLDMTTTNGFHPYKEADSLLAIDKICPPNVDAGLNQFYREKWLQLQADREAIHGDVDKTLEPFFQNENQAAEALIVATPTSVAGLCAVLRYMNEVPSSERYRFEEGRCDRFLFNLASAAAMLAPV